MILLSLYFCLYILGVWIALGDKDIVGSFNQEPLLIILIAAMIVNIPLIITGLYFRYSILLGYEKIRLYFIDRRLAKILKQIEKDDPKRNNH